MSNYYYALSGQPQGPITTEQLRELANAGRIQPGTMIYKEGQPQWVPAAHFPGLVTVAPLPLRPTQSTPQAPKGSGRRLALVVGGVLAFAAALMVVVFCLLNQAARASQASSDAQAAKKQAQPELDDDLPPSEPVTLVKKDTPPEKKAEPLPELTYAEILTRYQKDPHKTLQELQGKRVLLKLNFVLEAEDLIKCIDKDNNLKLWIYPRPTPPKLTPQNTIVLTFPNVNPNSKLGFFAKIREYAAKWKRGDKVEIRVVATLGLHEHQGQKFLHFGDAEVQ